ncbi:MAG: sugar phosphate isomerase/epimerase [Succinivibrio sp.]|nr:sugar phosphate isomerase/epimerase [Succinivibrio sp.]
MVDIGVRAHDYGKHEPELLAQLIAADGFNAVQLAIPKAIKGIEDIREVDEACLKRIDSAFRAAGVSIKVLSAYQDLSNPDPAVRESALETQLKTVECAHALNVPFIASESTFGAITQSEREEAFPHVVALIKKVVAHGRELNVAYAIESVHCHCLNSLELMAQLHYEVRDSTYLKLCFDPANQIIFRRLTQQDEIYARWFAEFEPLIEVMHLKDFRLDPDDGYHPVALGTGQMRFDKVREYLKHTTHLPVLIREEQDPQHGKEDTAFIRQLLS